MNDESFGVLLERWMVARGLSDRLAAAAIGCSVETLQRYIDGQALPAPATERRVRTYLTLTLPKDHA